MWLQHNEGHIGQSTTTVKSICEAQREHNSIVSREVTYEPHQIFAQQQLLQFQASAELPACRQVASQLFKISHAAGKHLTDTTSISSFEHDIMPPKQYCRPRHGRKHGDFTLTQHG